MSAAFTYPALSPAELHTPTSVLRSYREFLASCFSARLERRNPKVLCIGVGGLRDAEEVLVGGDHSFTVLEEDPWRIAACRQEYSGCGIRFVEGLLDDPGFMLAEAYDFIYNFNGLAARGKRDARVWIRRITHLLAPEGRALWACFTPAWPRLYAETNGAVTWPAVLRDSTEIAELVADLDTDELWGHEVRGHAIWKDDSGALAYLEIAK